MLTIQLCNAAKRSDWLLQVYGTWDILGGTSHLGLHRKTVKGRMLYSWSKLALVMRTERVSSKHKSLKEKSDGSYPPSLTSPNQLVGHGARSTLFALRFPSCSTVSMTIEKWHGQLREIPPYATPLCSTVCSFSADSSGSVELLRLKYKHLN